MYEDRTQRESRSTYNFGYHEYNLNKTEVLTCTLQVAPVRDPKDGGTFVSSPLKQDQRENHLIQTEIQEVLWTKAP